MTPRGFCLGVSDRSICAQLCVLSAIGLCKFFPNGGQGLPTFVFLPPQAATQPQLHTWYLVGSELMLVEGKKGGGNKSKEERREQGEGSGGGGGEGGGRKGWRGGGGKGGVRKCPQVETLL